MRIEPRQRMVDGRLRLKHHDLCLVAESEDESKILGLLGQPGTTLYGEVRLADGYGEHYLLLQPHHQVLIGGSTREFSRPGASEPGPVMASPTEGHGR